MRMSGVTPNATCLSSHRSGKAGDDLVEDQQNLVLLVRMSRSRRQ